VKKTIAFSLTILVGWLFSWFLVGGKPTLIQKLLLASTKETKQENSLISLQDIELADALNGWISTGLHFYTTQDGGNTWDDRTPAWGDGWLIQDAQFVDTGAGWLVATQPTAEASDRYAIARTVDQGKSWQVQLLDLFAASNPNGSTEKITLSFIDPTNGWMVVKSQTGANFNLGSLFKTQDGGLSWQRLGIPIGDGAVFTDLEYGWTAGGAAGDEFYATTDGGSTWQALDPAEASRAGEGTQVLYHMPVIDRPQHGMLPVVINQAGSAEIVLYVTQDGGKTWGELTRIQSPLEIAPGVPVPISLKGYPNWLVILPPTGQLLQVNALTGQVIVLYQDELLRGTRQLSAGGPQTVWASYQYGACTSSGCQVESGLVRFEEGLNAIDQLTLLGVSSPGQTLVVPALVPDGRIQSIEQTYQLSRTLTLTGQGFDKCEIATLSQFQDWIQTSPYKTTNLYIGGISRACSNTALTADYLKDLSKQGWFFIPTWVGPQPPCTEYNNKIPTNTSQAYQKGIDEAKAAVEKAASLGLTETDKSGSVIYYDIEGFDVTDTACKNAVRSFVNGWSYQIKQMKNLPGVYGRGSVLNELDDITNPPDVIWPANWYCPEYPDPCVYQYREDATVWNVSGLPNTLWADHQRIRQYAGPHNETWGNTTLKIDSNVIDGVVADISGAFRTNKIYVPFARKSVIK
jgi:photosystem II stability/assembly factor-like uncharacterized protein